MDAETLLPRLFPQGHAVVFDGEFFTGPPGAVRRTSP